MSEAQKGRSALTKVLIALGGLVVVVLVGLFARGGDDPGSAAPATSAATQPAKPAAPSTTPGERNAPITAQAPGVPPRAYDTLTEIDAGRWPDSADAPGTKGGDRWQNREGTLPRTGTDGKPVTYQEWDVNPKQRNRTRDAERIVTGSDGTAWYTGDHYATFTRMR
ncbi:ribonuclease domain-containing protein [Nocardia asteroides]|uniref:ribonuclease domain-containing protein n=1 Tax=Nocardia asteroides TaxID=1824 RepID=UPI001E2A2EF5|nr:ribonuclease domain-containing protein [Nocardia asteroides]UGT60104.1 ribonuclease [Nocardia asteroides]